MQCGCNGGLEWRESLIFFRVWGFIDDVNLVGGELEVIGCMGLKTGLMEFVMTVFRDVDHNVKSVERKCGPERDNCISQHRRLNERGMLHYNQPWSLPPDTVVLQ